MYKSTYTVIDVVPPTRLTLLTNGDGPDVETGIVYRISYANRLPRWTLPTISDQHVLDLSIGDLRRLTKPTYVQLYVSLVHQCHAATLPGQEVDQVAPHGPDVGHVAGWLISLQLQIV